MPDEMIWLVSYPKSGNTWFRFVIFYLFHGRLPSSSSELDIGFNSKLPVRTADWAKKSHAQFDPLKPHLQPTDRIIYVYRHPLDVLQSALNYALLNDEISDGADDRQKWINRYIENSGHGDWLGAPYDAGTWPENITSWMSQEEFRTFLVSYEETKQHPTATIAALAKFLNLDVGARTIQDCAIETSFESLRSFETKELDLAAELGKPQGRFSQSNRLVNYEKGIRFFNQGKTGSYREQIHADDIARAWTKLGPVATKLGYTIDD